MSNRNTAHAYDERVERIIRMLRAEFGSVLDLTQLSHEVVSAFARLESARVSDYVPLLVERRVRALLVTGDSQAKGREE